MLLQVFFFLLTCFDSSKVNSFIDTKSVSHKTAYSLTSALVVFGPLGPMRIILPFKLLKMVISKISQGRSFHWCLI